jgi:hypothetical protein
MSTEIIEGRADERFGMLMERADLTTETLEALLRSGYRSEGMRRTIGEGILLHHDRSGPDLVLYPDGSLHPVGVYQQAALGHVAPQERPARALRKLVATAAKWIVMLALASSICMLSIAFWLAVLEGF